LGWIGQALTDSKGEEIRDLGWLSLGVALSYATNFLPTAKTVVIIGFFTVLGISFLVRKDRTDRKFGLTLIVFGVGLIAPSTGVFLSALCSIAFLALALVILCYQTLFDSP
jgi:ABC-type multidrug transport system permease subunit